MFAPSQDAVDSVRSWLESAGVAADRISQSVNKQWMQFDADASEIEKLLRTEYYLYSHSETGKSHIACREYVHLGIFIRCKVLRLTTDTMSPALSVTTLTTSPPVSFCVR